MCCYFYDIHGMAHLRKGKFFAFSLNSGFLLRTSKANLFTHGKFVSIDFRVRTGYAKSFLSCTGQVSSGETELISGDCAFMRELMFWKVLGEKVPGRKGPGNSVIKTRKTHLRKKEESQGVTILL